MSDPLALLRRPVVLRLARMAIGLIFIAAALGKIGDQPAFALQVHNFRLAPLWSEHLIAVLLPWIELVAGLALVLGVRDRAGAMITLGLMLLFTVAVASAWSRGLNFTCGCFGNADASKVGAKKLVEDLGLTALALVASMRARS